jgi:hypothetical protein
MEHLLTKPGAPPDLGRYGWIQVGWNEAGRERRADIEGVAVMARASGKANVETPMGTASCPWWAGWDEERRIAVLCVGAQ